MSKDAVVIVVASIFTSSVLIECLRGRIHCALEVRVPGVHMFFYSFPICAIANHPIGSCGIHNAVDFSSHGYPTSAIPVASSGDGYCFGNLILLVSMLQFSREVLSILQMVKIHLHLHSVWRRHHLQRRCRMISTKRTRRFNLRSIVRRRPLRW